jgi:hypothetical protein
MTMRRVKHGLEEANAYCRCCGYSCHEGDVPKKALTHHRQTGHTIDIYRENWVELYDPERAPKKKSL